MDRQNVLVVDEVKSHYWRCKMIERHQINHKADFAILISEKKTYQYMFGKLNTGGGRRRFDAFKQASPDKGRGYCCCCCCTLL